MRWLLVAALAAFILPAAPAFAQVCGDGVIEGAEACDDDNTSAGDGCDASCAVEAGYKCVNEPSRCYETTWTLSDPVSSVDAITVAALVGCYALFLAIGLWSLK